MVLIYGVQFIWIMYTVQEIWISIKGNMICNRLGQLLFSVFARNKITGWVLSSEKQIIPVLPKAPARHFSN